MRRSRADASGVGGYVFVLCCAFFWGCGGEEQSGGTHGAGGGAGSPSASESGHSGTAGVGSNAEAGTAAFPNAAGTGASASGGSGTAGAPRELPGESDVEVEFPDAAALTSLNQRLGELAGMTASDLEARHALGFVSELGYEPSAAIGLDRIQSSAYALSAADQTLLSSHGFVIRDTPKPDSFADAYLGLYAAHLPVFNATRSTAMSFPRSFTTESRLAPPAFPCV